MPDGVIPVLPDFQSEISSITQVVQLCGERNLVYVGTKLFTRFRYDVVLLYLC